MDYDLIQKRLSIPIGKLRLVIDTDTKNEVDDQFAIAWALLSPERFAVEAIYAAPFSFSCVNDFNKTIQTSLSTSGQADDTLGPSAGMEASFDEILRLFQLLEIPSENKVFHGSNSYLPSRSTPVESDAARDLIRRAHMSDELLYVAAIATLTNIASAILMDPSIIDRIVVVWLGGQPLRFGHGIEFNLMQDVYAAQVLFDSGVPLVLVPGMTSASHLSVSGYELSAQLKGRNAIGNYLTDLVLAQFHDPETVLTGMQLDRYGHLLGQEDQSDQYLNQFSSKHIAWSRTIWDISTIAYLKNPNWTPSTLVHAPVLLDNMHYLAPSSDRHPIRQVNYCFRDAIMGDMFYTLQHA